MSSLTAALLALVGAAALVPVCKWIAVRVGCVSAPKADRWHQRPTPLLGGLAIVLPVLVGVIVSGDVAEHGTLVACAGLIALVGLLDDIVTLSPATKLVAQIALASVFVFMGYRLHWVESLTLDSLLTLFWVVGITNAFNLLDNMDGLCAGIALHRGHGISVWFGPDAAGGRGGGGGLYLPLLVGAVAGFLFYNVNPASIFMGDAGSLFLGMSLAGVSLESAALAAPGDRSLLAVVAAPVLILMIPILDTTLVTLSRLLSGRSASQGGRDHSSHRLVAIGLSERRAVAVLWGLAALAGVSGFYIRSLDVGSSVLVASTLLLGHDGVYGLPDEGSRLRRTRSQSLDAEPASDAAGRQSGLQAPRGRSVAGCVPDSHRVLRSLSTAVRGPAASPQLSELPPVAAGRRGQSDRRAVRPRGVPRHLAVLQPD